MNIQTKGLETPLGEAHEPTPAMRRLLDRMPADVRDSLNDWQLAAVDRALDFNNPTRHAVNLRLTLFGRAYFVLLGGPEQRAPDRRAEERRRHPLRSPGNIAVLSLVALLGLAAGHTLRSLIFGS